MKYLAVFLAALGLSVAPVSAAGSTIRLNESGPFTLGDAVTFASTVEKLKGSEYPMVYVECKDGAGVVLYGQLDYPSTVFVLGGGWSPWRDRPTTNATCTGTLYAYGGKVKGYDTIRFLAATAPFAVSGQVG